MGGAILTAGTVKIDHTGPAGNNFDNGDFDDTFAVDLVAGQVVELEFAADPADSDADLYVLSDDKVHGGVSDGTDTRYDCVQVSTSARYYIDVAAFRGASIYKLKIGAPGSAASCAVTTTAVPVAPGRSLAQVAVGPLPASGNAPAAPAPLAPSTELLKPSAPAATK